ncbi:MAG: hypothetical protein ACR2NP_00460 [Pirellulaceae bacterium]
MNVPCCRLDSVLLVVVLTLVMIPGLSATAQQLGMNDDGEFDPTIVCTRHGYFWHGQMVTWDEIVDALRDQRDEGPVQPRFCQTNGFHEEGMHEQLSQRIMEVYRELMEPAGLSYQSISPRGCRYWDSLRSSDDLDPADADVTGLVLLDGRPAAGTQIVVLPTAEDHARLAVQLDDGKLAEPLNEHQTTCDEQGQFRFKPIDEKFFLAAVHPEGFAMVGSSVSDASCEIELQPWGTLSVTAADDAGELDASFVSMISIEGEELSFSVRHTEFGEDPVAIALPPGTVTTRYSIQVEESRISVPAVSFELGAGETKDVVLEGPDEQARDRAAIMRALLEGTRESERRGGGGKR